MVVANILQEALVKLASTLTVAAMPGTKVCLTGLRCEPRGQLEKIQNAFEEFGSWKLRELGAGWCLLEGETPQARGRTKPFFG